jgi:hypothetical protein
LKIVFDDPTFSSLLLRTIAETYYKGADISECLSTAYRIKEGDFEGWYKEWLKTAKRVHRIADDCISKGHTISAREAYLRASNYYRTAEFLLVEPEDPRIQTTIDLSKDCFSKAVSTFPIKVESIEIPYEETTLPGYFYHTKKENINDKNTQSCNDNNNKQENKEEKSNHNKVIAYPTLIAHGGFDSTLEELYSFAAAAALERGYNC